MEFIFGLVAAAFFSFSVGNTEEDVFFLEKEEVRSTESVENKPENAYDFLPKPENAALEVQVFLTFECEHCRDFFFESLLPLKDKILEKKLPVAISLLFLPSNQNSEEKIHEFFCVQQFAQKWEAWSSAKILFESENFTNEISEIVEAFGFPEEDFLECRYSENFQESIAQNISDAEENGISLVPSVLIEKEEYKGETPPENLLWGIEKKLENKKKF